jgi:D-alanyl-D-alanine carboxypeptidase/D-alanyl-D-alanine-endopeptidase (penicillin-binding protein 4)
MPRLHVLALCLAATYCASAQLPAPPPPPLAEQITQILSAPEVARDHWGIYVTTLDGTPIYALNEAQLFQPASNAKLFTTSAALALLGSDRTFETKVTGKLNPATHSVEGDLTLVGVGDANLDSQDIPYIPPAARPKPPAGQPPAPHQPNPMHDINDLVAQLVAKGVKQVAGDIVGDDTLFPWDPYPESWSIDDAVWGYGAPISALTISDNELRLSIAPATAAHQPATVTIEQAVPYYTVQNETQTVATKAEATGVQITRTIGSRTLRLFGSIALKDEPDVEHVAIEDPAEYAAMVLRAALLEHGIAVSGTPRAKHQQPNDGLGFLAALHKPSEAEDLIAMGEGEPGGNCSTPLRAEVLATHQSAPLSQDVVLTNKVSQNLHAELLLHQLGRRTFCGTGSGVSGARMVRAFLIDGAIDANDFIFFDGSGLSGHDLVTPRATARLLSFAATQPWFATWRSSLPEGGEDGSLAERFKNGPIKDHVFAKTGTLSEARALSGYLDAASGRTVIFSIMVGNHLPGTTADRDAMDKIVAAIQASE